MQKPFVIFAVEMEKTNHTIPIPEEFKSMLGAIRGLDAEACIAALDTPAQTSLKINLRKLPLRDVASLGYKDLEPVSWCDSGFYLDTRPSFTLNPLLHAGCFYVQEASSMIYETLVRRHAADMPPGLVLDLCAAPGGKTTSIINALPDGWHVVANEYMPQRAVILRENLLKWGYPEITVTNNDVSRPTRVREAFSIVAVDAPCSGEGMMRKEMAARSQWSPGLVRQCAALQQDILHSAVNALAPGGLLLFSTCTFNTLENEENLRMLVEDCGLTPVQPDIPKEWNIHRQLTGPYPALRFMPHITRGEGLFAAILRKPGDLATPKNIGKTLDRIRKDCRVIADGFPKPVENGRKSIPAPEEPLDITFDPNKYPRLEVDIETALQYLRREAITAPAGVPTGLMTVCYDGHPLGLLKNLGNRANNLYPKEWRIRNL